MVLEDEPDPAAVRRNAREVDAVEEDATGDRALEPRDHAEQRALARSARPEDGDDLALADFEADAVERARSSIEPHRDLLDAEHQVTP